MTSIESRALGDLRPEPGERCRGMIRVPGVEPAWEMPAWVVRGKAEGPTLAVTAGVHAAEYPPIEAATRFARALDPAELRGTVVVVTLVNTPGFFARSLYVNPRDGQNLNRAFPGSAAGPPSERVANFLLEEVIRGADAYLDLHCGDLVEALEPFSMYRLTGDPDVDERADRLARAYGIGHLIMAGGDGVPGSSTGAAAGIGVPAVIVEIGQQGIIDEPSTRAHLSGLESVLRELGMLAGRPFFAHPVQVHRTFAWLRAPASGLLTLGVRCGEVVQEGQPIGELRDLFGDRLEELVAPDTGVVLFAVTSLAVPEGGPIVGIGAA
ncbi:MAG: succinylglutamate desuccinylase/aspartoacylase family protein [Candidatus Dormibacteraceae bacterium]